MMEQRDFPRQNSLMADKEHNRLTRTCRRGQWMPSMLYECTIALAIMP